MSKADKLVQTLQGTMMSLDDGIQEVYGDEEDSFTAPIKDIEYMEQEIFCCETCQWWYEICEMHEDEDQVCEDCHEE